MFFSTPDSGVLGIYQYILYIRSFLHTIASRGRFDSNISIMITFCLKYPMESDLPLTAKFIFLELASIQRMVTPATGAYVLSNRIGLP